MDSVKQSAALCLLRLYKTSPDLVLMGEWTSRVVHLLNDQHMVGPSGENEHHHTFVTKSFMEKGHSQGRYLYHLNKRK